MTREEYQKSKLFITKDDIWLFDKPEPKSLMSMAEKPFIQNQVKKIMGEKPKSVLEIGYGFGLTAEILSKADRYLVIEPHPELAIEARLKGYEVWEGFAQDFESDEEWDVIYDDRDEVLDEPCKLKDKVKHKKYITLELCR